jgi:catechol 2,3-dioxygenase-like lactoylglutathione lyase family enzyme
MRRVVGIDRLVLSVGDLSRSKEFYGKVLDFSRLHAQIRLSRGLH